MSNNQLPADVHKRIKLESLRLYPWPEQDGKRAGYIAGATVWAETAQLINAEATIMQERAQKQIKRLLDTLEKIVHGPVPANDREYMSWFVTAKNIAGGAISEYEADIEMQQWKEGKESDPIKEIEYMPILSAELSELREFNDVPVRVPMHLLNKAQAESNHGQTLQRLKERGGLGIKEALSLITLKNWSYYRDLPMKEAIAMLNDLITNPPK